MEIKPQWLLEGESVVGRFDLLWLTISLYVVAPHYFKPADLEQLATGDKKMPKAVGSAGEQSRA